MGTSRKCKHLSRRIQWKEKTNDSKQTLYAVRNVSLAITPFNAFADDNQLIEVNLKVGKNVLMNRLTSINGLIEYDWLNLSRNSYKVKVKDLLLSLNISQSKKTITMTNVI